jgi:hypothetical protein
VSSLSTADRGCLAVDYYPARYELAFVGSMLVTYELRPGEDGGAAGSAAAVPA